jgi:hypothetical protein
MPDEILLTVSTQEALRRHAKTLRTNSLPLSTFIPLLNKAADRIDELEARVAELQADVEAAESNAAYYERCYERACADNYMNIDPYDNPEYDPALDDR